MRPARVTILPAWRNPEGYIAWTCRAVRAARGFVMIQLPFPPPSGTFGPGDRLAAGPDFLYVVALIAGLGVAVWIMPEKWQAHLKRKFLDPSRKDDRRDE